jgi:hypothetical protein
VTALPGHRSLLSQGSIVSVGAPSLPHEFAAPHRVDVNRQDSHAADALDQCCTVGLPSDRPARRSALALNAAEMVQREKRTTRPD